MIDAACVDDQQGSSNRAGRRKRIWQVDHDDSIPWSQPLVAPGVALEELDARDLEPHEVVEVCATPCASVSAKRTRTAAAKSKPSTGKLFQSASSSCV